MSFTYGKNLKIQVFGQSHAAAIGVVLDGLPAGEAVELEPILQLMARRAPGKSDLVTARREADSPEILCGLVDGHTVGAPLTAIIRNTDVRSADYANLQVGTAGNADDKSPAPAPQNPGLQIPRPGHSDWPAYVRYAGAADVRGGGAFSGRMTAPLCFAGGVAAQLLARRGVRVYAHIDTLGDIQDSTPDFCSPDAAALAAVETKAFPTLSDEAGAAMAAAIRSAAAAGDSVGGSIRCIVTGLAPGLGAHMFDGVENRIAAAAFGIPGVRGIEFGSGFAGCCGRGSEQNDPYIMDGGAVRTAKNDAGGVLGGATTGMPLVFRLAIRPTPSIGQAQRSVDLAAGQDATLAVKGRHDPCILPRAVPVVQAVAAIALLDILLDSPAVWN